MENPQVYTGTNSEQLYGVNVDNRPTTIRQKLDDLFKPSDFVRVINIDDQDFTWQALDPADENVFMEPGPQKTTVRGLPKLYTIRAGQSMVLPGWNAQIMIEKLYKKVAAKDALARKNGLTHREAVSQNLGDLPINWGDNEKQQHYIHKIFVGVETPSFGQTPLATAQSIAPYTPAAPLDADKLESVADIAKDLGLDDTPAEA